MAPSRTRLKRKITVGPGIFVLIRSPFPVCIYRNTTAARPARIDGRAGAYIDAKLTGDASAGERLYRGEPAATIFVARII